VKIKELEANEINEIILSSAPYIINIWDETPKHIDTNKKSLEIFGLENKAQFIERFHELSPEFQPCGTPSDEKAISYVKKAFQTGYEKFEWLHCTLDGELLPTEITLVRFTNKGQNMLVAYGVDLRPVKAALKKEYEAHETIQTIFNSSPIVINLWDDKGKLISTSEHALELHNVPSKEEYIEKFHELSPERQPCGALSSEMIPVIMDKAYKDGYARFEWMHCTLDGRPIPTEITLVRFDIHGKSMIVAYTSDLTQVKAAMQREQEILEESNAAKSRFLARMSHEIRTPISAVMGISEIQLQVPGLPPDIEEAFAKIHNSSIILLELVNDILDLSKIEAGKMSLMPEKYSVACMINDVVNLHLSYADSKNVIFGMHVDENLPKYLIGDVLRIKQVMSNLLSNAFKYTESGKIELTLAYKDKCLVFSVSDTGVGMTPGQVSALKKSDYTRFHELENPHISGTGLGMPIVYNLAQMMDAYINVESEAGKGTSVIVKIPQQAAGDGVLGKKTTGQLQQFKIDPKKFGFTPELMPYGNVLVVDDVKSNLYVARGLLSLYGLTVETCNSGSEAIIKINNGEKYDIIFMDQMMPELDGTQTMQALRELGYTQPIVMLTANALRGQSDEFIKIGFDDFISKPIDTKHLHSILKKFIRDKKLPNMLNASKAEGYGRNPELVKMLKMDFYKSHKNTFANIKNALENGDIKTAHLLAHTIKGLAGLIFEDKLMETAKTVEDTLSNGKMPTTPQAAALEEELARVIKSISLPHITVDGEAARLLDELIPLIKTGNTQALSLAEGLRGIPEAAILHKQIENFDFKAAMNSADTLKKILCE